MDDNRQLRIFYIARVYQLAGQFWLAMSEYKKSWIQGTNLVQTMLSFWNQKGL